MAAIILLKAHIKAHARRLPSGKVVQVAAHTDRRHTALAPGQLALFTKPEQPDKPNPYKDKHPVHDTPDLFGGHTGREIESRHAEYAKLFKPSLGIAREDMPQIPGGVKQKFLDDLRAAGVSVHEDVVDPESLKPTQATYNAENMDFLTSEMRSGRYDAKGSILTSADGRVIDGHHRWAVAILEGRRIPVVKIGMPARELLDRARKFGAENDIQSRGTNDGATPPAAPAKPHPLHESRARLAEYQREHDEAVASGDKGGADFAKFLLESHGEGHQALESAFAHFDKHGDGLELSHKDGRRHVIFLPDASNPGKYRYQMFDERGMMSHSTHDSPEEAVADAASSGYTEHNPGVLDRLASTETWEEGMAINALIQAHGSGQFDYREMIRRMQEVQAEFKARRDAREAAAKPRGPVTETPEFKQWFGDSKVVNADGTPMRVFHGTGSDIAAFDTGKSERVPGIWMTPDQHSAGLYAKQANRWNGAGPNIMPLYAKLENPRMFDSDKESFGAAWKDYESNQGYDGFIVRKKGQIEALAARHGASQIKSAIGNSGAFNPGEADITKSLDFGTVAPTVLSFKAALLAGLVPDMLVLRKSEDLDELIAEHERLVRVLNSPDHADDKREARRQGRELAGYRRERASC